MTYDEFVATHNGQPLDWDHQFGAQCVDLVAYYVKEVYGVEPIYANAAWWWHNFGGQVATKFDRVANGPTNVPKKGDIMVYKETLPGSGGAGHIEIFDHKTGPGRYVSFSQNWGGMFSHMVEHTDNYQQVIGWLTPKPTVTQGDSNMFQNDQEVKEAYLMLRGNEGSAGERAGWIGQPKQNFFKVARAEADSYRKQLADVSQALKNEQNKPPKEVIKTVTQIVEKPVEVIKEVPVEVDPSWLVKTRDFILTVLKLKKG